MNITNLTKHAVNLPNNIFIGPSGLEARCNEITTKAGTIEEIEIITRKYGTVENLPAPVVGNYYIVSAMVRMACPDRKDLFSPGDLVRDEKGNIIGCKNLIANW